MWNMKDMILQLCIVVIVSASTSIVMNKLIIYKPNESKGSEMRNEVLAKNNKTEIMKTGVIIDGFKLVSKPLDDVQTYISKNLNVIGVHYNTDDVEQRKEIFIKRIEESVKENGVIINGATLYSMPLDDYVNFLSNNGHIFGWNNRGKTEEKRINDFINYVNMIQTKENKN